jgi:hypothetical protein
MFYAVVIQMTEPDPVVIADADSLGAPPPSLAPSRNDKRERKHTAQSLPPGITHNMMKKFVVYYREFINLKNGKRIPREYFKVESHPKLARPWVTTKSTKVPLLEKLKEANDYVAKLDEMNDTVANSHLSRLRLPKYTSSRMVRDTPAGTIYSLVYDRKDTVNGFRWTSSHTFTLNRDAHADPDAEFAKAINELQIKLQDKYGADIIVM